MAVEWQFAGSAQQGDAFEILGVINVCVHDLSPTMIHPRLNFP